jgi:hypothetical protein
MSDPHGTIGNYRKGGSIMSFLDDQNQMWIDALIEDVKEALFENWTNAQLEESEAYNEHKLMEYASEDMQQKYNEYYGYGYDDEFYFVKENEWDKFIAHQNKEA